MTNNDYRQFIAELEFIGKDKRFSGIINKLGKAFSIKSADKLLKDKRQAYDFMVANLFKKYGIVNDALYSELDEIWDECNKSAKLRVLKYMKLTTPILGVNLAELQLLMNEYIKKTYEYCSQFAKELVDGQE